MFDGVDAQRRGCLGLASARTADEQHVIGDVDKFAAAQLSDRRFVDFAAGEVEAGQIAIGGEARGLELIQQGKVDVIKVDVMTLVPVASIEAFLAAHAQGK